ncbi:hypothetical protein Trydic_g1395, partial [Trypoxylus dichotomus]
LSVLGLIFVFQQENYPKYTTKLSKDHLQHLEADESIKVMEWPLQNPDLNPIELLWEKLDRKLRKGIPTSLADLWKKL